LAKLAGFNYQRVIKKLKEANFEFDRYAKGSHEIWINMETGKRTTIPNHPGDIPEGTLRAIIRQAGITPEEFLSL
jgi:predicted RNA binding protein YcfA (HicA-like mRNA interferase family)